MKLRRAEKEPSGVFGGGFFFWRLKKKVLMAQKMQRVTKDGK